MMRQICSDTSYLPFCVIGDRKSIKPPNVRCPSVEHFPRQIMGIVVVDRRPLKTDGIRDILQASRCKALRREQCGGFVEHSSRVGWRSTVLLEVREALAKGQMTGQLDKAKEIAALATTVTVEEIFAGVDIERRVGFLM